MQQNEDTKSFFALIKAAGYRPTEFSVKSVDIPRTEINERQRYRMVVTRTSNSVMRAYLADDPVQWLAKFVSDLKLGIYGAQRLDEHLSAAREP